MTGLVSGSILAIETTTPQGSVAVWRDGALVVERTFTSERNHNAVLFDPLAEMLEEAGELERVIVGTGPGSYNGARVAIATAQGIGTVRGVPVIGLSSYLALPTVQAGGEVAIVGDARRRAYSWQPAANGELTGEIELLEDEAFAQRVADFRAAGGQVITIDAPEVFARAGVTDLRQEMPQAQLLFSSWEALNEEERVALRKAIVEPIYVRPPNITPAKKTVNPFA